MAPVRQLCFYVAFLYWIGLNKLMTEASSFEDVEHKIKQTLKETVIHCPKALKYHMHILVSVMKCT